MPPDTETKPKRQTWFDVMPDGLPMPELLSHAELLEELHRRDIDVQRYTLEYYRRNNIIPRPIRRQHAGAVRPVYPHWYVSVIEQIKRWQAQGKSLDDIREAIQPVIQMWAVSGILWRHPILDQAEADLDAALRKYAAAYADHVDLRGRNINTIRVSLFDDEGKTIDYHDTGPS